MDEFYPVSNDSEGMPVSSTTRRSTVETCKTYEFLDAEGGCVLKVQHDSRTE